MLSVLRKTRLPVVSSQTPVVDRIFHDEVNVGRFVSTLGDLRAIRSCYEAGPTGYELARFLHRLGVACEVIAPSLIPVAPGSMVKTDARDARRLAHLYRSGKLVPVYIPTPGEEAIRDLACIRADLVIDRTRACHRLSKFLLRHGEVFRGGKQWTIAHETKIPHLRFEDAALSSTFSHLKGP
jgi:transposase